MAFYTAQQLSEMTLEEIIKINESLVKPTQQQKVQAWKRMDIGIYNSDGILIGDRQMHEDGYDE